MIIRGELETLVGEAIVAAMTGFSVGLNPRDEKVRGRTRPLWPVRIVNYP